ncbi:winged helix-turn-helix domain-containing protein [Microcoleus sp. Pol7_A1]|uniref:winged helix-turn-helix domain-containing protein n=1 Tax=Microcoleus sp. Pol7_A1 TaxID=2818893 RepID=UPI002FD065E4
MSAAELKHRYRETTNPIEARRWQLLWLISLSWTIKEAAAVIGINYDYARTIVKSYNQQGETAILQKKQSPKKRPSHTLLNAFQLEELRLSLKGESPDRGIWSGPKVALWVAQKTGREQVGKLLGWDYLKKCGYSPQKPRPRHKKREKIEQEEFKKNSQTE